MNSSEQADFGRRYAAAWSSQDPQALAACYAENGALRFNDAEPAIGREAIVATAQAFMDGFPDMVVRMESIESTPTGAIFHWLWTGTNTGPGGTGNPVRLNGFEEWSFDETGLILTSKGHFDEEDYERQLEGSAAANGQTPPPAQ